MNRKTWSFRTLLSGSTQSAPAVRITALETFVISHNNHNQKAGSLPIVLELSVNCETSCGYEQKRPPGCHAW